MPRGLLSNNASPGQHLRCGRSARVNHARNGHSVFDFLIGDAMSSNHVNTGFAGLLVASTEDLGEHVTW